MKYCEEFLQILEQNNFIEVKDRIVSIMNYDKLNKVFCDNFYYPGFKNFQKILFFQIIRNYRSIVIEYFITINCNPNGQDEIMHIISLETTHSYNIKFHSFRNILQRPIHLIHHHELGQVNMDLDEIDINRFFNNPNKIRLKDFLNWFRFDYQYLFNTSESNIVGGNIGEKNLTIEADIANFGNAFFKLRGEKFITDDNFKDYSNKFFNAYHRNYRGEFNYIFEYDAVDKREIRRVNSLDIFVSYSYYQGDNPRDGNAFLKICNSKFSLIKEFLEKEDRDFDSWFNK